MASPALRLTDHERRTLVSLRHDLHRDPELSGHELRTTEKIRAFVEGLPGWEVVGLPVEVGLVARLSGTPGEVAPYPAASAEVMLRADIDALPVDERTDVPWRSRNAGVMHACGHDIHAAGLCGAALLLSRAAAEGRPLPTVDLVFQSAEETGSGAAALIGAGLFERISPDICLAVHNWPSVSIGHVVCEPGARMAALRNFEVVVHGRGGHGSMPHLNADPIVCAAAIVQDLQTVVSRGVDPLVAGLLSISMIEGGTSVNRVADDVRMCATLRSLSDETLDRMAAYVERIVSCVARAHGCAAEVVWGVSVHAVINDAVLAQRAEVVVRAAGLETASAPPTMVGEDFSRYRDHVPTFLFWVGTNVGGFRSHELHDPCYLPSDDAIEPVAHLLAACATTW